MVQQPNTNSRPQSKHPLSHQQSETPAWTRRITRRSSNPTQRREDTMSAIKDSRAFSDTEVYSTGRKIHKNHTFYCETSKCAAVNGPFGRSEGRKDLRSFLITDLAEVLRQEVWLFFRPWQKKPTYVALNDTKHTAHITYTSEVWFCVMLLWEVRLSPIFRYYCDVPHYVNNPQYFCLPDEEARTRWLVKNYSFGLSSSCWFTDK